MPENLKKIRERGISFRNFKKLIKGENIPYTAYKERMKKRVKEAEKLDRGKVNKDYFYPKIIKTIEKEYKNKKLETQEPEIEPVSSYQQKIDLYKQLDYLTYRHHHYLIHQCLWYKQ